MRLAVRTTKDEQLALLVENTTMFEKWSEEAGTYAHETVHNLLRGIIVQSWTAFEFLSEELFAMAEKEAKTPLPRVFSKKGRDLTGFRSRLKIRDAYGFGFAVDGASIIRPLDDKSIDALSLLRNVIVHKAAKADLEFVDNAKQTPLLVQYATLTDKAPVVVDGLTVYSIVNPVIQNAYAMIEAVDVWLKTR